MSKQPWLEEGSSVKDLNKGKKGKSAEKTSSNPIDRRQEYDVVDLLGKHLQVVNGQEYLVKSEGTRGVLLHENVELKSFLFKCPKSLVELLDLQPSSRQDSIVGLLRFAISELNKQGKSIEMIVRSGSSKK